jgi:L-threonylcarbamoyladenylate synthase
MSAQVAERATAAPADSMDVVTVLLTVRDAAASRAELSRAAACLRDGGLVAFPTETVYGLGAHALDRVAVRRVFEAKGRPSTDPLIVHVASVEDVHALVASWPDAAARLAARFWPGPLTMVLPKAAAVPGEVTAGLPSVAVRVPAHPIAQALLTVAAIPVAAPSANLFSRPSPTTAAHVLADLDGRVDLVLDAGPASVGVESTVVDLTGAEPVILRPGGTAAEDLAAALGSAVRHDDAVAQVGPMVSPGLLERHYAPCAPLTVYEGDNRSRLLDRMTADVDALLAGGRRVGLLLHDEDVVDRPVAQTRRIGSVARLDLVAARLYAELRALDTQDLDAILAHGVDETHGLGAAVRDRLRRAASGRIVRT